MPRFGTYCIAFGLQLALTATTLQAQSSAPPTPPTFTKDVAPILQKNCQTCHRPGEGGPFPLIAYDQVKPMATSIKRVVSQKIMPPWFADPKYGHFINDRSLPQKDIATLVQWVNGGAQEGDPKDMPAPAEFPDGWGIPKPDVVFQLAKPFNIPASGTIDYQYMIVPT
jgi:mono/diheme cytochrome c family protein